jgi:hypothetical protein
MPTQGQPPIRDLGPDDLYRAARTPELVRVPERAFLMIDGAGGPDGSAVYQEALGALYTLSWTLRFAIKKDVGLVYRVAPLEGLWWAAEMAAFTAEGDDRATWRWTMMIAQPDAVTPERLGAARVEGGRRHPGEALARVRLERFAEGLAVQVLHVGPYEAEGPTIERLHAFIAGRGYRFDGRVQRHHEIYLGDPRRTAPAKLRTIVRQPVVSGTT